MSYGTIENGLKEMKISSLLKGGMYEVSFGYHSEMGGYTTLMSDIPKLYEIALYNIKVALC